MSKFQPTQEQIETMKQNACPFNPNSGITGNNPSTDALKEMK